MRVNLRFFLNNPSSETDKFCLATVKTDYLPAVNDFICLSSNVIEAQYHKRYNGVNFRIDHLVHQFGIDDSDMRHVDKSLPIVNAYIIPTTL